MKKVIIILIILVILSTLFFIQKQNNWTIYKNSRYNFAINYPANWELGAEETNNAGRIFKNSKLNVECYAYGFANALEEKDGTPQSLNGFIDWLIKEPNTKIIERKETKIDGIPAVHLLKEQNVSIQESVYALGNETGIGFFCNYQNLTEKKKYEKVFNKMVASIKIFYDLNGTTTRTGISDCQNLLNGAIEPLEDLQTFIDDRYTEVVVTSRESWNKNKLPWQVLDFEKQNYQCYPEPLEINYPEQQGDYLIQPQIKTVRWQCEQKYQAWQYLSESDIARKSTLEKQGYDCKMQKCFDNGIENNTIWLCVK